MDKANIKSFAISARVKLKAAIAQKAFDMGVFEDRAAPVTEVQGGYLYNEQSHSKEELAGRRRLIETISLRADGKGYSHGYAAVMEEVAYTWFNRLIALRFMELNGYLPSGIRVLSNANPERLEPDCIREAESLDFVDQRSVAELSRDTEKLYRYILIAQCNALSSIMPRMFERIADYTELLLPDQLYLREGNIVYDLVHGIFAENFTEQVEIVGWLYQFYISEKKDEVFAGLKKNIKITKENIPAATQLFTPDWIVKYMVENSLGRIAVEELGVDPVAMGWNYFLPEAEQTAEVMEQLTVIRGDTKEFDIRNIKVIDPCMGSGHILVYAFDVLVQIYEKIGYSAKEIPNLIFQHNLFGLDIDERAGQLAYFALMMKARGYSRRFFRQDSVPQPQVYAIPDYQDWKEYGSLVKLDEIPQRRERDNTQISLDETDDAIVNLAADVAAILTQKYDVVVTNPPYMGSSGMGAKMAEFVKKEYPDSKSDLFAVFIEKCGEMLKAGGYQAMITQHAWMFLSSYEKLRTKLMRWDIVNMAHLGARAFEEIGGEVVQTTAFVMRSSNVADYRATFVRLVDYNSQQAKETAFLSGGDRHTAVKENFEKIPGMPVAYWVSVSVKKLFEKSKFLGDISEPRVGMATANNERFLRLWHEINIAGLYLTAISSEDAKNSCKKWFPITKGGENRLWYGNNDYLVNWENDGAEIRNFKDENTGRIRSHNYNLDYIFQSALTWTVIGSDKTSFRYTPEGFLYSNSGYGLFSDNEQSLLVILGLLNSKVSMSLLNILAPSMGFESGYIRKIPFNIEIFPTVTISELVNTNISISKTDWDSFEISWDFVRHPLLKYAVVYDIDTGEKEGLIELMFEFWQEHCEKQFAQLKANEEELNRIFIEIYGLQDELTSEVADKDVTIRRADLQRDVRSFISYGVGCIFGRYSLDVDGLAYAGGTWDSEKYKTFLPDKDNILPITDSEYFDDDLITRFFRFVETVYGAPTLGKNLEFIADALYPNANGTAREKIRRYFVNDFYKDHMKIYQKRPIYWQFDSGGKQNGFQCLIYLHRYDKYTVARVRTDYLHPLQRKYEAESKRLDMLSGMTENPREKAEYKRTIEKIEKQLAECRAYDPALAHIAHQAIELDLDDGVTVNYAKFMEIDVGGERPVNLLTKL